MIVGGGVGARECVRLDLHGNKIIIVAILLPWIEVSVGPMGIILPPWQFNCHAWQFCCHRGNLIATRGNIIATNGNLIATRGNIIATDRSERRSARVRAA